MNGFDIASSPHERSEREPDDKALAAIARVRPVLGSLQRAGEAIPLPARTLLHAGPPYATGQAPPAPVANSAAAAIVFEHWADDRTEALAMLRSGEVRLESAQDHDCVVPLASVLSPSQYVQVVHDAAAIAGQRVVRGYAPLNGGNGPALRLGLPGPEVVAHLRWLNGPFADAFGAALGSGIELLPVADHALVSGDDCHGRTAMGSARLLESLSLDDSSPARQAAREFLAAAPSFFLNLWMAAVKCMLAAANDGTKSTVVTAMGGNGIEAGLKLACEPERWYRCASSPPIGPLAPGNDALQKLPAIGDSALIEAFGLGAMAMSYSPAQREALGAFMPESSAALAQALLWDVHPGLPASRARFGLSARAVLAAHKTPVVALGVLDAEGRRGRIGGGIWQVPAKIFAEAVAAVEAKS